MSHRRVGLAHPITLRMTLGPVFLVAAVGVGVLQAAPRQAPAGPKPDLPTANIASPEEIKRDFVSMRFSKPLNRPDLGFTLLVPKGWSEAPVTVSKEQLAQDNQSFVSLAQMTSSQEGVAVEVAYCRLPATADLERIGRTFIEKSGMKLVHAQKGEFNAGPVFDTLVQAGGFTVRMTFSRHGDKVYLVSGSAPDADYAKNARALGLAAVSFQKLP